MKLGFVGVGIMGKPMALNLLKQGYEVTVYDLNAEAVAYLIEKGAQGATSPKEAAADSDLVITMLPHHDHVKAVLFSEDGVVHGAKAGTIVVDMSSISPVMSKEIASQLNELGIHMLDAPVSGGEPKAVDGTLAIMVGGDENIFHKVKPILACMGTQITYVGGQGSGSTAKLANQIIVNVNIAAMSEALILAAKAGLDIDRMYQAIRSGLAGSAVLDAKVPMILERNFIAGGRIDINHKDLTNVMDTAQALDVPLPLTSHVLHIFEELKAAGRQADDHAGIVKYYEKLANIIVTRHGTEGNK